MTPRLDQPPLVQDVIPALAGRIQAALAAQGEERLAEQVPTLRITGVCACEEPTCASFHTGPAPMKRWVMRGRQVELADDGPGSVTVDVIRGEIAYVEVLGLDDVRRTLDLLRPR